MTAQLGRFLMLGGAHREADPVSSRRSRWQRHSTCPRSSSTPSPARACLLTTAGRLGGSARSCSRRAIARAEAQDLPRAAARALNNLGVISESADRFSETLATYGPRSRARRRAGDQAGSSCFALATSARSSSSAAGTKRSRPRTSSRERSARGTGRQHDRARARDRLLARRRSSGRGRGSRPPAMRPTTRNRGRAGRSTRRSSCARRGSRRPRSRSCSRRLMPANSLGIGS